MSNQPTASNGRPLEQMMPSGMPTMRFNTTTGQIEYRNNGQWIGIPNTSGGVPYTGAVANVDLGTHKIKADVVQLSLSPSGTGGVGIFRWNDADGTVDLGMKGGNVTLQIGQENLVRVVNKSGINLLEKDYQAVKIAGATGQRLSVNLAQANNDLNSATTIGLVTENINNNQEGFVTTFGRINEINTTGALQGETWIDGDVLYLSPTVAGAITNIKPTAPQHLVTIGYVEYAHAIHGKIFVKVDNGYELEELHNVVISEDVETVPSVLGYNIDEQYWENKSVFDTFPMRVTEAERTSLIVSNGTIVYQIDGVGKGWWGFDDDNWVSLRLY
jgi:hypothetical protein